MNTTEDMESGYLGSLDTDCYIGSTMRDVEVLHETKTNVIARGRRYGRIWFLKALREEFRDSVVMRRQLLKEFELHSRLRHPSVVQAVGLEEIDGLGLCIIQEWIDGTNLQEALRKGVLSKNDRNRIIHELTCAIAYIHNCGVVHRDLKPSNIMLRNFGGEVVLVDFGLADSADYVEIKQPAGTPGFISPEQEISGGADPRDDVYSLGVIMAQISSRFSAVSRRCVGSLHKRPANGSHLLKMLEHRARLLKIFIVALIVMIIGLFAFFAVRRIRTLEQATHDSESKVAEFSEKNVSNVAMIASLKDSLTSVKGDLDSTQNKLTTIAEYENLKLETFKEGCRLIDTVLARADSKTFSRLKAGDIFAFNDNIIKLTGKLQSVTDDYCSSRFQSNLAMEDLDRIRMDLYNYQGVKLSEYQEKWLKKINRRE